MRLFRRNPSGRSFAGAPTRLGSLIWNNQTAFTQATPEHPAKSRRARGYSIRASLHDDRVADLDQLLFRFGRLQDAIGQRLFQHLLALSLEWEESEPFFDKLSRLERLRIIPSAEQWILLRELRNSAMHEYPDQPELTVANLNRIHEAAESLEQIFHAADQFAAHLADGKD